MNKEIGLESKSKFCQNPNYSGLFKFQILGIVNRNDILGTLYKKTNFLGYSYSLSALNQNKRLGLITIDLINDKKSNQTYGEIKVPIKSDEKSTCLICALIQNIDKVGPYKAIFKFKDFQEESTNTIVKIANRAKQIYQSKLLKYKQGVDEIIESLFSNLTKVQIKELVPGIWVGPRFLNSQEVYLLEGRADILNLSKAGIYNTISVNGLHTPDDILDHIYSKTLTCMFDRDRGGQTILYNLSQKCNIDYFIQLPDNFKVEELSKSQILTFIKDKKIFLKDSYNKYYTDKYNAI